MKHTHKFTTPVMGQAVACKCGAVRARPYNMDKGIEKPLKFTTSIRKTGSTHNAYQVIRPDGRVMTECVYPEDAAAIVDSMNSNVKLAKLLSRILGMHETKNCGAYNGEAILSQSMVDEIRDALRTSKPSTTFKSDTVKNGTIIKF
jgi:hypothetical protein